MHRKKWLLLVAAFVAILALAAAGCGGDEDEGEEAAATEAAAGGAETGAATEEAAEPAAEQTLRVEINAEPPSLDPSLATDNISAFLTKNIFDALVKLDESGAPVPNAAESWDVAGPKVTFTLRSDLKWSNGDPLTAADYEYSWKRILDPELAAEYAYQLYGIEGAQDYNSCEQNCAALRDKVDVTAVDDRTLEVTLTSEQPWFVAQMQHQSYLPVHQATVEQFGDQWTEPGNIITSGPFTVTSWEHEASMTLEKWEEWRGAADVSLTTVQVSMIPDAVTALSAFEAGEVDACHLNSCIPPQEIDRLKETPEFAIFPTLSTYYYGFNVKNVTDLNQRRAMAFALDRQGVIDNITKANQIPATGMSPEGLPGFDVYKQDFLPPTADVAKAQEYLDQAQDPKTKINLIHNDAPGHKEIAQKVQADWQQIGIDTSIKSQEWAQFLEFIGPPPDDSVDVFRLGWGYDFPDAFNGLELWTCESGNNSTNYCDPEFDRLVEEARATPEDEARWEIYRQLEEKLFGPEGALPIIPIYWYTNQQLVKDYVEGWVPDLLGDYDLTKVSVSEH